jgi:hypothetical protein
MDEAQIQLTRTYPNILAIAQVFYFRAVSGKAVDMFRRAVLHEAYPSGYMGKLFHHNLGWSVPSGSLKERA